MSRNAKKLEAGGEKVKVTEVAKLKGQIEYLEKEKEKLSHENLVFRSNFNPWKICDELSKLGIKEHDGNSVIEDTVKTETRQLKVTNQYLKMILENLHKNIIVGEATSQKELKPPEDITSDQTLRELTTTAQKITHKFYELDTELDYVHRRISQLSSMIAGVEESEVQIPPQERTNKFTAIGRKQRNNPPQTTPLSERSLTLDKDLELVTSAWREMKEKERLSEHAGALLTYENPSIADLRDPNRPTKLTEKYSELYDNQWTDAFAYLSKKDPSISEEKLTGYLYEMLVDGYRFCQDVRQTQIWNLEDIMLYPADGLKSNQRRQKEEVSKIFAKNLSDAAKLSSNVTSANMAKAFVMDEKTKDKYREMIKPCETYIQECVELCWHMQVQTPPVCLDVKTVKGKEFKNSNYREYTTKGKKIAFVVWPALFLHENGPLLSKGVAQGQ